MRKNPMTSPGSCARHAFHGGSRCRGAYRNVRELYRIGPKRIPNLLLRKCNKCGHTILPWSSVIKVDKALQIENE